MNSPSSTKDIRAIDYIELANQQIRLGDYDNGLYYAERSGAVQESPAAYVAMAWAHGKMGDLPRALECCDRALTLSPDFGHALNTKGVHLMAAGRPVEALPFLIKAATQEDYPNRHYALINMGVIHEHLEDKGRAVACYENALALKPDCGEAAKALDRLKENL